MIYCVVPRALEGELYDKLVEHYSEEPNVEVIVDRRAQGGEPGTHDPMTDRRRVRPKGSFPPIDAPTAG
ncbi:MAG TPA: hypothetical protein VFQ14_02670 [Thermoleophilaceae bacterium]|nr:hypothetical protein [Thermoleophilaceae bacterium]